MEVRKISSLNTYVIEPVDLSTAGSIVILLHGYGADGRDLIPIAESWHERLRNTIFLSPDAPDICEESPLGYQWFSLGDLSTELMADGVTVAAAKLDIFVSEVEARYKIPRQNIILSGFSQGAMLALYTGLTARTENHYLGILGYSGILLNEEDVNLDLVDKTSIHLIHGMDDPVVPSFHWNNATSFLKANDFSISGYKAKGIKHEINFDGIESGLFYIFKCMNG